MKPVAFLLLLLALAPAGCKVLDPEEEVPVYVKVNAAQVWMGPQDSTLTTVGIKDLWVFHDTGQQGVYPQPSVFPAWLSQGESLRMYGGIFETGQSGFHVPYPFWQFEDYSISGMPGDTVEVNPVFHYTTAYDIPVEEDFEGTAVKFSAYASFNDTAQIRRTTFNPFQKNNCGVVHFDANSRFFQVISTRDFTLDPNIDIYAEVTYRTDVEFQVGLQYQTPAGDLGVLPAIVITPRDDWNTVYVHLVEMVRNKPAGTVFKLWFYADGEAQTGDLFLDNLRIIHFTP